MYPWHRYWRRSEKFHWIIQWLYPPLSQQHHPSAKSRSFFMINHHSISTLAAFLFSLAPSQHGSLPPRHPPIYRSEKCNNSFAYHVTINYDFHYIWVVERVRGIFYHYVIITVIFICMDVMGAWGLCGCEVAWVEIAQDFRDWRRFQVNIIK